MSISDTVQVMGILNVTPDSFSDGGRHFSLQQAVKHAGLMVSQGADILDIGGESTRPGAAAVSEKEELERVIPVVEAIRREMDVPISVDTSKPQVMREAAKAGATLINDVNALRAPGALEVVQETGLPVCLMHMQGEPRTMQRSPSYQNVVDDVLDFLKQRIDACVEQGIDRRKIWIDPGFGFGKTLEHNLALLKHLERFQELDVPVLAGISRKSMIGQILGGVPPEERIIGSVAAAMLAVERGAQIIRVHDVKETVDALKIMQAVQTL